MFSSVFYSFIIYLCHVQRIKITSFVRLHKHLDFAMDLANAISSFSMVTLCSALIIIHVLKIVKYLKSLMKTIIQAHLVSRMVIYSTGKAKPSNVFLLLPAKIEISNITRSLDI